MLETLTKYLTNPQFYASVCGIACGIFLGCFLLYLFLSIKVLKKDNEMMAHCLKQDSADINFLKLQSSNCCSLLGEFSKQLKQLSETNKSAPQIPLSIESNETHIAKLYEIIQNHTNKIANLHDTIEKLKSEIH
jgi:peptidoglycan hydrolase CwlO-like protein